MLCSDTSFAKRKTVPWHFKELSYGGSLDTEFPLFITNRLLKFVADCQDQNLSTLTASVLAMNFTK